MGIENRGFASMTLDQRRAIASMGGKACHAFGRGHEFTPDEARIAGRIGGRASAPLLRLANAARAKARRVSPAEAACMDAVNVTETDQAA